MKKLLYVNVGWKYIIERNENGSTFYEVKFPEFRFEGDDLKGRTRWTDNQLINLSIDEFEKIKGFRSNYKDEYIGRIYSK
jgi:hypothetical protein